MNKRRMICIRDPRLRRLRNSLRNIIVMEAIKRRRKIDREVYALSRNEHGNYIHNLSEDIMNKIHKLVRQADDINVALKHSVVKCPSCGKNNRDVEYYPQFNLWFCVKCIEYFD
ncbi:MAG: hypothetical protein ACTSO4_17985 [Promethearchaeota archaeon]